MFDKIAMPWDNYGDVARPRPKSVRRAGFAGFAADSQWHRHFSDNGQAADQADHIDDHLGHFITHHSPHWSTWHEDDHGARPKDMDLSKPLYATQSHVAQYHIDRYKKNPKDESWAMKEDPDPVDTDDYPGHTRPMFVTHQGRTHVIEGHHRVAAAIQSGQSHITGLHYDLDAKPVVKNSVGHDCPTCQRHQDAAESQSEPRVASLGTQTYPLDSKTAGRAHQLFGRGLHALFTPDEDGPPPTRPTPWPQASQSKTRKTYDEGLVGRSITHPHDFKVEDLDPRELHSTQPSLTRGGVQHYMNGGVDYEKSRGGGQGLGNDVPRVYHRIDDDQHIILSGHHRAASALLRGEPFRAMVIHGGWGEARH